jgi:hypothetical protein
MRRSLQSDTQRNPVPFLRITKGRSSEELIRTPKIRAKFVRSP